MYAIILAAGRGARAWPVTDEVPKSMIPIAGKPFLERQIEWLKTGGITKIIIDENYKAAAIDEYFGDGSKFGVSIMHRVDPSLSIGAIGHIKRCLQHIPVSQEDDEDVLIMAGDVLTNADLPALLQTHKKRGLPLTFFCKELQPAVGIITVNNEGRIMDFRERPTFDARYVNTSIGIVPRSLEAYLPPEGFNFWAEALRIFQGTIYTESHAAWWHITDISDAYRMDGEFLDRGKVQELEGRAKQYEELAAYTRMQADRYRGVSPRGRGKERL